MMNVSFGHSGQTGVYDEFTINQKFMTTNLALESCIIILSCVQYMDDVNRDLHSVIAISLYSHYDLALVGNRSNHIS